jgi:alkyl hydroperoxide reductase subunit AhpC
MTIKFQKYAVVNALTGAKARVRYYINERTGIKIVEINDKDYGRDLARVFEGIECAYRNETDTMTDYFCKGEVQIHPHHPLYADALKRAEAELAAWQKKYA